MEADETTEARGNSQGHGKAVEGQSAAAHEYHDRCRKDGRCGGGGGGSAEEVEVDVVKSKGVSEGKPQRCGGGTRRRRSGARFVKREAEVRKCGSRGGSAGSVQVEGARVGLAGRERCSAGFSRRKASPSGALVRGVARDDGDGGTMNDGLVQAAADTGDGFK